MNFMLIILDSRAKASEIEIVVYRGKAINRGENSGEYSWTRNQEKTFILFYQRSFKDICYT